MNSAIAAHECDRWNRIDKVLCRCRAARRLGQAYKSSTQSKGRGWKINGQARPAQIDPSVFKILNARVRPTLRILAWIDGRLTSFVWYHSIVCWSGLDLLILRNGNGNPAGVKSVKQAGLKSQQVRPSGYLQDHILSFPKMYIFGIFIID